MFNFRQFQENLSIECNIKLISFLFNQKHNKEISRLFHQIPFIMDRNKYLRSPVSIYFPSEFDDVIWHSPECPDAYVHHDLMKELQPEHRQWLGTLGMVIKTDLTFFLRTIIPHASTFITPFNALFTIQKLFHLYINQQITSEQLNRIGELCLLTEVNTLIPANRLYLPSSYNPRLSLDDLPPKMLARCVSTAFVQNEDVMKWKEFFLRLGVQENINLIRLDHNCTFRHEYHEDQVKIIFGLNSQQVHGYRDEITLSFLEFTDNNHHFARIFWSHVIETIDIDRLNQSEIAYWGVQYKRGAVEGTEVYTFPQWFIRTKSCIPVLISSGKGQSKEQCLKESEIFTKDLSSLTGRYLPIFDNALNNEWQKFFRFKTEHAIDNCLFLLKQIYMQNQSGIDVEDELRIQRIYEYLLNKLSQIDQNQREFYQKKCRDMNLCLLCTTGNLFMPPEELHFWSITTFSAPSELYRLYLTEKNHRHRHLSYLLYILNINHIQMNNLDLIPINANPCNELTNRLQKSYFLLLLDFYKIEKKDKINQLDNIRFFEADRLEIIINNLNIFVGNPQIYEKNNCLYTIKPWDSSQLAKKICELLNLRISEFETRVYNLLTTPCIDDYFNEVGIRPANTNSQITNSIEQDNLNLLNQLPHLPPSHTPAQLLIAGLEAQNPNWTGYIYHYTHLENAVSILRDQSIKSRHQLGKNTFKDSSVYDFMSQTNDQVNHYVRFYFRSRTLTQLHNENLGSRKSKKRSNYTPICPVPIFFRIKLQEILNNSNIKWKISSGDMSSGPAEYDCTLDIFKRFDFFGLFEEIENPRGKHSAQLEFLIENQFDLQSVPADAITLVCQNLDAKISLEHMFRSIYNINIDKNEFFEKNNRIFINHEHDQPFILVTIDSRQTQSIGGMFIVQIKSNSNEENIDVACEGDICATIYSKEQQIRVFVGKLSYTVYYKYEEQLWLIYTNHNTYEFDDSHKRQYAEFIPYHS